MGIKFGKLAHKGINSYKVHFWDKGNITRNYATLDFAIKRAIDESGKRPAIIKRRGVVIAIIQRNGLRGDNK